MLLFCAMYMFADFNKAQKMHYLIYLPYSNTNLERYNDIIPDKSSVLYQLCSH